MIVTITIPITLTTTIHIDIHVNITVLNYNKLVKHVELNSLADLYFARTPRVATRALRLSLSEDTILYYDMI